MIGMECLYHSTFWYFQLAVQAGWTGGAMVLGKLPVPGHPTNLD